MNKLLNLIKAYISKVSTPTLLYVCLLYIVVFIGTLPGIGIQWKIFQIFVILGFVELFGFIVFLRHEFDLVFIRIQGQTAGRIGALVMAISFLGCFILYLSLWF